MVYLFLLLFAALPSVGSAADIMAEDSPCQRELARMFDVLYADEAPKRRQIFSAGIGTAIEKDSKGSLAVVTRDKSSGQILVRAGIALVDDPAFKRQVYNISVPFVTPGLPQTIEVFLLNGMRNLPVSAPFRYQLDADLYAAIGEKVPFLRYLGKSTLARLGPVAMRRRFEDQEWRNLTYVYFK